MNAPGDARPGATSARRHDAREGHLAADGGRLFIRSIGKGWPVVVVHGGPDFDHRYLLPEMDRLADDFHLVYYDQRGRGRSSDGVVPEDVSIASEVEDLERVRRHLALDRVAVLGHSWGGVLAMEYAIRHPDRVSHLILMNTAPASSDDYLLLRDELSRRRTPDDARAMAALSSTTSYRQGDPDTVAEYYRIHFRTATCKPESVENLVERLRASFAEADVILARAIEDRLTRQSWLKGEYDLVPKLGRLRVPALVLHGDHDFIPVECAARIAKALPRARLVVLEQCGHFAYLERPDQVRRELAGFLGRAGRHDE